jgi:hypothetical protein
MHFLGCIYGSLEGFYFTHAVCIYDTHLDNDILTSSNTIEFGYPGDNPSRTMWGSRGKIRNPLGRTSMKLEYDINSYDGQKRITGLHQVKHQL